MSEGRETREVDPRQRAILEPYLRAWSEAETAAAAARSEFFSLLALVEPRMLEKDSRVSFDAARWAFTLPTGGGD